MSNVSYIQIPNSIVRDSNINSLEFCILLCLKHMQYLTNAKEEILFNKAELSSFLNVTDNRTLKKAFQNLKKHKYILNDVEFKKKTGTLAIINKEKFTLNNGYTRLPVKLFEHIQTITPTGVRLMYYYESYINRQMTLMMCYPSQEAIRKDIGLSIKTIIEYNKLLVKSKLLKVTTHEPRIEYTLEGIVQVERYNNHYEVRLENLL